MEWVIIIIVILVLLFIIMNLNYNKKVEQHHINRGGFRKSFPKFTGYLETVYEMTLANDTGRSFSYSKIVNDSNGNEGILFVGVKLNMADEPIMFTKFQSKYKGVFSGMDVSSLDYNSIEAIEKCINISIEKLKSQGVISYQDKISKFKIQTKTNKYNENENATMRKLHETEKPKINEKEATEMLEFIVDFLAPDDVCHDKFRENIDILVSNRDNISEWNETGDIAKLIRTRERILNEGYGTKSVKTIYDDIPPVFSLFFVAAYPDVFQWVQDNNKTGKVEIINKIRMLPKEEAMNYFQSPQQRKKFYRSLINQYKEEGNVLETKNKSHYKIETCDKKTEAKITPSNPNVLTNVERRSIGNFFKGINAANAEDAKVKGIEPDPIVSYSPNWLKCNSAAGRNIMYGFTKKEVERAKAAGEDPKPSYSVLSAENDKSCAVGSPVNLLTPAIKIDNETFLAVPKSM